MKPLRFLVTRRTAAISLAFAAAGLAPFGAGGVADVISRLVAEAISKKLGQSFVIENMPGPGGIAAARAAISGGRDGYTLALQTSASAISAQLFEHLPFDPLKDFAPISTFGYYTCYFAVRASSPYKTLGDFLEAAREKPANLNVGTIKFGSGQNLTAELFKSMADINVEIVTFRGSPEVVVGLLRDDIQLAVDFYAALKPSFDGGQMRALASTAPQRSPELPNVPTVQEAGVAGFDVTGWNALYAPAGTPNEIVQILNKALHEVLADPELERRALDLGISVKASTPAELDAYMRSDIDKWGKVIASAHVPKQ
jgi:tripartite-type tricarboxylate transporter receptor subunit TctC